MTDRPSRSAGQTDNQAEDRPDWETVARQLYRALDGIFCEELNGRLCALPDQLPDPWYPVEPGQSRESKCCPACRKHWDRTKAALAAFEGAAS